MLAFHPPRPPIDPPPRPRGRGALLGCCGVVIACAFAPWTEVAFPRLWGTAVGPRGIDTVAGTTASLCAALIAVLMLIEGRSATAREAVRPGVAMLGACLAVVLLWEWWRGAAAVGGVTGRFTTAFHLAALGALSLAGIALRRAGYSSSGPPT